MKSILVKYIGPTDTKGARLKASASGYSVTVARSYDGDVEDDAILAVKKLATKLGWSGHMVMGHLSEDSWVAVHANDRSFSVGGWSGKGDSNQSRGRRPVARRGR